MNSPGIETRAGGGPPGPAAFESHLRSRGYERREVPLTGGGRFASLTLWTHKHFLAVLVAVTAAGEVEAFGEDRDEIWRAVRGGEGTPPVRTSHVTTYVRDGAELTAHVYRVAHTCPDAEVGGRMRAAVAEFLLTAEGAEAARENRGDFNWGDAAVCLTAEAWGRHGIVSVEGVPSLFTVDHDENFWNGA